MAIVAHTPYSGNADAGRTNDYLTDGHGLPEADRTNRYLTDGHGLHTICEGHNCPADPKLATEYMHAVRLNYERQHPQGEGRTKGTVTHEQLYVSPTEEDNVPADERMQMAGELIERTPLRDFPSIRTPHDNTPDKHVHISLCPYSVDGTHKLCLNNAMLNTLRREMDYICVEHGYSIVENPELWGDKKYRDWFFEVKEKGIVKVHPPKDKDMTTYKEDRKRARTYSASKESKAAYEQAQDAYYKQLTKRFTPEHRELFYISPFLYSPANPNNALIIKKRRPDGKDMGEMEQMAASLFTWSRGAEKEIDKRNPRAGNGIKWKLHNLGDKAYAAAILMRNLDIRTHKELIRHTREVGGDISDLKKDIARQETIIRSMADVIDAIDRWENFKDPDAYAYLKSHRCGTPEEIADAKKRHARAIGRKAKNEKLLEDRKAEYRHLKEAESVLQPASSEEHLEEYLAQAFTSTAAKKIGYVDSQRLTKDLYELGDIAGLPRHVVDGYIQRARATASKTTLTEYGEFVSLTYRRDKAADLEISAKYAKIKQDYADIRQLRGMGKGLGALWLVPVFGAFAFVLTLAIGIYKGVQISAKKSEIEQLKWEAEYLKESNSKEGRLRKRERLASAKTQYEAEILGASREEIEAAQIRFYKKAAEIVGRFDVVRKVEELERQRKAGEVGDLNAILANAVNRALTEENTKGGKGRWQDKDFWGI